MTRWPASRLGISTGPPPLSTGPPGADPGYRPDPPRYRPDPPPADPGYGPDLLRYRPDPRPAGPRYRPDLLRYRPDPLSLIPEFDRTPCCRPRSSTGPRAADPRHRSDPPPTTGVIDRSCPRRLVASRCDSSWGTPAWCAVTVVRLGQALGRGGGGQFLHAVFRTQAPPAQLVDGATHRVQVQPCALERQVGDQGPLEGPVPAVGFPGGRAGRPQEVPRQRGGAGAPVAPFVPGGRGVGSRSAQARRVRAAGRVAVERDAPVGHRSAHGIGAWRTVSTGPDAASEGTGVRVGADGGVVGVRSEPPPHPARRPTGKERAKVPILFGKAQRAVRPCGRRAALAAARTCRESPPGALPTLVETAWNAGFPTGTSGAPHGARRNPTHPRMAPPAWNAGFSRHSGPQGRGRFVGSPGALARCHAIPANEVRLAARLRRAVPAEAGVPSRCAMRTLRPYALCGPAARVPAEAGVPSRCAIGTLEPYALCGPAARVPV